MKSETFMAIPQDEMLEIVEQMDSLSGFVEEVISDYFFGDIGSQGTDKSLLSFLSEYFSGCYRIKEMVLEAMNKSNSYDLKGRKVPENSVIIPDSEYLLMNNLLIGMLSLQIELLDRNISLSIH